MIECIYCGRVILDGQEPTSYGICPKCLRLELKRVEEECERKEGEGYVPSVSNLDD
jgi:predicted  nucleic acid-binding Zn-ribbon protein